ncbi:MAG TPA: ROK family glucokinase [Pseudonocardiaceae bacterium]|nr:ROK family glucokinase [Pseudonocardiaceae bacterium]
MVLERTGTLSVVALPAARSNLTIGVDIGGTKVAAGVVDECGALLAATHRDTPADDTVQIEHAIVTAVGELTSEYDVEAVGIGAAGFIDAQRATVMFAPNLAWRDEPLQASLQRRLRLPVVIENDANAAAWAEVRFGAGRGVDHVVTLTLGTGIGGGIVVNGQLLRGQFGAAAEFGHLTVVPDGRYCGCGLQGCWEQYASGRALEWEAQELARVSPAKAEELLLLAGGRPENITGRMITQAAAAGDVAALQCFEVVGTWLGRGLAGLAAILDPGLFVIGGGVSAAGEVLRAPTKATFHKYLTGAGHRPMAELRIAELGPESGLIGAADLARFREAAK